MAIRPAIEMPGTAGSFLEKLKRLSPEEGARVLNVVKRLRAIARQRKAEAIAEALFARLRQSAASSDPTSTGRAARE